MTTGEEITQGLIDAGWLEAAWQYEVAGRIDAAIDEAHTRGERWGEEKMVAFLISSVGTKRCEKIIEEYLK